jgi:Kef-type K+ transport system membrane component KefB
MEIFTELSLIIAIVTVVSIIMKLLRQPLVVGYILSGILVGPYFLNIIHSTELIELFSKIGISILLFIVGLSLNPMVIKEVGKVSFLVGTAEILLTTVVGFIVAQLFGFNLISSIFIAAALSFSSTIIILKLLTDKGDINKLYSKIAIGILLVEDLVATILLLVVSTTAHSQNSSDIVNLAISLLLKGLVVAVLLYVVSRYVLPRVGSFFATSQELLFLFSLAWGLGLSVVFYQIGFSIEIGALIAGVALSLSPFAYEIGSRMRPLRDFFIIIFFIMLGSHMVWDNIGNLIVPAVFFSLCVLVGRPFIVFMVMNIAGYRPRPSFQAGLTLAQISEFSLILMALAVGLGRVTNEAASLVTLVAVMTIAVSSYFIVYSDGLYRRMEWLLKRLDIFHKKRKRNTHSTTEAEVIIFGYDRVGSDFIKAVDKLEKDYLVVDFNPQSIKKLQDRNIPFRYGDAEDVEFLQELDFHQVKLIVSTIPDFKTSMLLINTYRHVNPSGIILVISDNVEHAEKLYLAGATYVVMPHFLGAHYASQLIAKHGFDVAEFERERNLHLQRLAKRELEA